VEKQVHLPVGVIIERRPAQSRWVDWIWRPVAVLDRVPKTEPGTCLGETPEGVATYYLGSDRITLHRSDVPSYQLNLAGNDALYVILRREARGPLPYTLHLVTASPSEAETHGMTEDEMVEPVPMPRSIRQVLEAFCEAHPVKDVFVKRKRDKSDRLADNLAFGKEPIFRRTGRWPSPGAPGRGGDDRQ
jgi:hypothetical protein